jgi:hypothetical protein
MDEIMGSLLALDRGLLAFCVTLRTRFLMPLRVGEPYATEARIVKEAAGTIMTEADVSGKDGSVHVMAAATYQPIRSDQAKEILGLDGDAYDRLCRYFDHRIGEP